jgi:hypothetical protein
MPEYKFEHKPIVGCMGCPISNAKTCGLDVIWGCQITGQMIDIPKDKLADCPLEEVGETE